MLGFLKSTPGKRSKYWLRDYEKTEEEALVSFVQPTSTTEVDE